MGSDVPKQFLPLAGIPVIVRTVKVFLEADAGIRIATVVGAEWMSYFADLVDEWELPRGLAIVSGGNTRFESVRNGLRALPGPDGWVAVHDAVRPMLTAALVTRVFEEAETHGSAVPAIPVSETIREIRADGSAAISRDTLRSVQTPQCFKLKELAAAYEQPYDTGFTDCATVMERAGHRIHLVEGEPMNIKLTTKADIEFSQWYLTYQVRDTREPG
jgi:2-C-methyl-D-erythritol 4-phosphate cytidylyltransferase